MTTDPIDVARRVQRILAYRSGLVPDDTDGLSLRSVPFDLRTGTGNVGDGLTLEGYAAVFNSPTLINDWQGEYEEVIAPGAFKRTLAARTPVLQFDHGQHPVLGSMPIGSIQSLREDAHGLFVRAHVFDNWMTEPLRQAIGDGAVDGMSFRFQVVQDTWDQTRSPELRTVKEVKLYELGPVVFPAYADTSVALRSLASTVPGLTLVLEDRTGTPQEPASARTSEGPAEDHDPVVDHSWDQQRADWLASRFPKEEVA